MNKASSPTFTPPSVTTEKSLQPFKQTFPLFSREVKRSFATKPRVDTQLLDTVIYNTFYYVLHKASWSAEPHFGPTPETAKVVRNCEAYILPHLSNITVTSDSQIQQPNEIFQALTAVYIAVLNAQGLSSNSKIDYLHNHGIDQTLRQHEKEGTHTRNTQRAIAILLASILVTTLTIVFTTYPPQHA